MWRRKKKHCNLTDTSFHILSKEVLNHPAWRPSFGPSTSMAPVIIDIQERRALNLASDLTKQSCDSLPPDPEIKYLIKKDKDILLSMPIKRCIITKIFGERMH